MFKAEPRSGLQNEQRPSAPPPIPTPPKILNISTLILSLSLGDRPEPQTSPSVPPGRSPLGQIFSCIFFLKI